MTYLKHTCMNNRFWGPIHIALGVLIIGLGAGSASADVLYDTTSMTDNGTFSAFVPSQISADSPTDPNLLGDMNAADDFSLSGTTDLTSITGDFLSTAAFGGEGVLVEFFSDLGGTPSEAPTATYFATAGSGLSVTTLDVGIPEATFLRFTVDLSAAGISLGAGDWWVSMVVVHETTPSQIYRQLRQEGFQNGHEVHVRDGGLDHANGIQGVWGVDDWTAISFFGNQVGDIAMRIEGTVIPGPSSLALLGLAGGVRRRRRRQRS